MTSYNSSCPSDSLWTATGGLICGRIVFQSFHSTQSVSHKNYPSNPRRPSYSNLSTAFEAVRLLVVLPKHKRSWSQRILLLRLPIPRRPWIDFLPHLQWIVHLRDVAIGSRSDRKNLRWSFVVHYFSSLVKITEQPKCLFCTRATSSRHLDVKKLIHCHFCFSQSVSQSINPMWKSSFLFNGTAATSSMPLITHSAVIDVKTKREMSSLRQKLVFPQYQVRSSLPQCLYSTSPGAFSHIIKSFWDLNRVLARRYTQKTR